MSRNTSISLGDHFVSFIGAQVKGSRYGLASDVVRAGLRLREEHEAKIKALQDALIAGEDSDRAERLRPRPVHVRKVTHGIRNETGRIRGLQYWHMRLWAWRAW